MGTLPPLRCYPPLSVNTMQEGSVNYLSNELDTAISTAEEQEELSDRLERVRPSTFFKLFGWQLIAT